MNNIYYKMKYQPANAARPNFCFIPKLFRVNYVVCNPFSFMKLNVKNSGNYPKALNIAL